MNIKSILTSITMISTLSLSAMAAQAHNTSNQYNNNSVTQYVLNQRQNEREIRRLEDKVTRLEELLSIANQYIERYRNSYQSQNNHRTTVYACSMPLKHNHNALIKIDTNQQTAKSDLIQQCRNNGLRQCNTTQITCSSTQINTSNNNNNYNNQNNHHR